MWRHLSTTVEKGDMILGKTVATESRYVGIMPVYS